MWARLPGHPVIVRLRLLPRLAGLSCICAATAIACVDGTDATCSELREALDPNSAVHLLSFDDVVWQTDPPTSGPHHAAPTPHGVQNAPIDPPTQVTILEGGGVLVQYAPGLENSDLEALGALAVDHVVVAPADGLPAPVVVTAWTWKLTCDAVDLDRIEEFARARVTDAPGHS